MTALETFTNVMIRYYGYDPEVFCEWALTNREAIAEKLYEDSNRAPTWAHDVMSLEAQWS